jgi:hypothetical protein
MIVKRFFCLIITVSFVFMAINHPNETIVANQNLTKPMVENVKVLVLNYDPIVPSRNNRKLHEYGGFNDPYQLVDQYKKDVEECSNGSIKFSIVKWQESSELIKYNNGYQYSLAEYVKALDQSVQWGKENNKGWWSWPGWINHGEANYNSIIEKFALDALVDKGEIDEVWIMAPPMMELWESTMVGDGAYWCNSNPVPGKHSKRPYTIMGFNYERGVGEMMEDLGHRIESIMEHIYGRWNNQLAFVDLNTWEKFTLYDKQKPDQSACGNIHFAPNSDSDYDWGNTRSVKSTADDWLNYPDLTNKSRLMNAKDWGNGDIRLHHMWWFKRIPHLSGRDSFGVLNNWWFYIVRYQEIATASIPLLLIPTNNATNLSLQPTFHWIKGSDPDYLVYVYDEKGTRIFDSDALASDSIQLTSTKLQPKTTYSWSLYYGDRNKDWKKAGTNFFTTKADGDNQPDLLTIFLWIGRNRAIVDNKSVYLDVSPLIVAGRTMVPLRFIGEAFGAVVSFTPYPTNEVTISFKNTLIHLWINNKKAKIEYAPETEKPSVFLNLDCPPIIQNGRTLVPLRFIADAFGAKVTWFSKEQRIEIQYTKDLNPEEPPSKSTFRISFYSDPSFARIYINREYTGFDTNTTMELKKGNYLIWISKEGYKRYEQNITVDHDYSINVNLKKQD